MGNGRKATRECCLTTHGSMGGKERQNNQKLFKTGLLCQKEKERKNEGREGKGKEGGKGKEKEKEGKEEEPTVSHEICLYLSGP